jgi:hypothetical protein
VTSPPTPSPPDEQLEVVLVVDVANVMGSVPDGWWRDRAAAATRLLGLLATVSGATVSLSDEPARVRISDIRAVVEGAAGGVQGPAALSVVRARHDGDTAIVEDTMRLTAAGQVPLVVTADRGLRARLPSEALVVGPGWLNRLIGR